MAKIYMKTHYVPMAGMEVPHSENFAKAMYGFREFGAEIVPYHRLDDIYDELQKDDIVLDYIS